MSLMSKLLTSTLIATVALSAGSVPSSKVLEKYAKKNIIKNPNVKMHGVTVLETRTHKDLPGWTILLTTLDINYKNKDINAPEIMFVKDGLITGHLMSQKTGKDYREEIKPTVPKSFYDDEHLIFGNKNAKHKILIFSDPQCPFCQDIVPEIFNAAKENPDTLGVYYYHLPLLRIHPVADVLTRVMLVAQHEGKADMVTKLYSLKIDARETNATKILTAVKKHANYTVTQEQIDAKSIKDAIAVDKKAAMRMMITGTPAVYIDGEWDKMRDGYKDLID